MMEDGKIVIVLLKRFILVTVVNQLFVESVHEVMLIIEHYFLNEVRMDLMESKMLHYILIEQPHFETSVLGIAQIEQKNNEKYVETEMVVLQI